MATFLVRYVEAGRDAQRGGQRRDLAGVLAGRLADARIHAEPGRLVLDAVDDDAARAVLDDLSGITSFSPAIRCAPDALEATVVARAAAIPAGGSFRIRCSSRERAARLGAVVLAARPDLRVDLHAPDVVLGVELRGGDAYVFDEVTPGRDWRVAAPAAAPTGELRFVADQMLGRLSTWLRLLGYDTVHPWDQPDSWVLRVARDEGRILLTRDGPLARVQSTPIYFVAAQRPIDQLSEVVRAFELEVDDERMFTRCPRCNRTVESVERAEVADQLPPAIGAQHDLPLRRCAPCGRIYWRGAHVERILGQLRAITAT